MKLPAMAGTLPFAHFLGRPAAAKADDNKEKDTDAQRAEDETPDDEKDKDDKDKAAKPGAEDDKPAEDKDGEDKDKAKGKKAGADGGDDGEDGDEDGDDESDGGDMRRKGARSARLRERNRCRAIFNDPSAAANPALACALAFDSDMPRSQAINALRAAGTGPAPQASRRTSLDERMSRVKTPAVGSGDVPRGAASIADQVIAAGKKRRGEI
jgi:hypothetical protein